MNAIEGLRAAGIVFLVRWQVGKSMSDWRSPDGSIIIDSRSVETLARVGHGSFVAWRVGPALRGSNGSAAAEPVVFRIQPADALLRVQLRQFEVETLVAGTGWAPRGNVFAADAKEALTVAMLAGLTFVREPHARAVDVMQPVVKPDPDAAHRLEVEPPEADE